MFQLDYQRLIAMLLPFSLRKSFMLAWLNTLLAPVKGLYMEFLKYRNNANYKMEHNGQVVYLQKVLNGRFDGDHKRIRISDGSKYDWVYIFKTDRRKPQYLSKIHVYDHLSYGETGADFQVRVPAELSVWTNKGLMAELRSLLNYYKLAGKRYKLVKGNKYYWVHIFKTNETKPKYLKIVHIYGHLQYANFSRNANSNK